MSFHLNSCRHHYSPLAHLVEHILSAVSLSMKALGSALDAYGVRLNLIWQDCG